jgi:hypothetical protein
VLNWWTSKSIRFGGDKKALAAVIGGAIAAFNNTESVDALNHDFWGNGRCSLNVLAPLPASR